MPHPRLAAVFVEVSMNTRTHALSAALTLIAPALAAASPQVVPTLVADIKPGIASSGPTELTVVGDQLFFEASDVASGRQPWVSDGTGPGTHLIKVILPSTWPLIQDFTAAGGLCFFKAHDFVTDYEVWRTDGTAAGTFPVTAMHLLPGGGVSNLFGFGGQLLFNGDNKLWRSDGTVAGTLQYFDLPGSENSHPLIGTTVGGRVFFTITMGATGAEPWITDGTAAGTFLVSDVRAGTNGSTSENGVDFNGIYFWSAVGVTGGYELWRSDGTAPGTFMVKDINPGFSSSSPDEFCVSGTNLFFTADDGTTGRELWVTDGSTLGTNLVKDILVGSASTFGLFDPLTDVQGTLFFGANDGSSGNELWTSDGTPAGTNMVVDLNPGASSSSIDEVFSVGNAFFYTGTDPVLGRELMRSDGTAAGTVPVFDLAPGSGWSFPQEYVFLNELLLFTAKLSFGRELYSFPLCELQLPESYCTAGTTSNGCQAQMSATGDPSAGAGSGFVISASLAEGSKDGLFFFGWNGRQANPWGNGTSYQCVVPPVKRTPLQSGTGTNGNCDGTFTLDFNALITAQPAKAPPTGSTVQIQCWFRDPFNTSNRTTSLSDALEFTLCP
jgi:ELWxxDGT repeat protein